MNTSIFYGGGIPANGKTKEESGAPLQGDALARIQAEYRAKAEDAGYSIEEILEREGKPVNKSLVQISNKGIVINERYSLELIPSERAFYILIARHPDGILIKDFSLQRFKSEYKSIYEGLNRNRKVKFQNDTMSFNLDDKDLIRRYRSSINKAISSIDEANDIDLSSCLIVGKKWRIKADVVFVTDISG